MPVKQHDLDTALAAREFIQQHFRRPITILDVSIELCTSESRLKRVFKKVYSSGINAFLTQVRMEKAVILVKENHKAVKEIALLTGYKSSSSFNRRFKQFYGLSPTDWYRNIHSGIQKKNNLT